MSLFNSGFGWKAYVRIPPLETSSRKQRPDAVGFLVLAPSIELERVTRAVEGRQGSEAHLLQS
jgi:hypothetical protein